MHRSKSWSRDDRTPDPPQPQIKPALPRPEPANRQSLQPTYLEEILRCVGRSRLSKNLIAISVESVVDVSGRMDFVDFRKRERK
jgi:hypothetical protein